MDEYQSLSHTTWECKYHVLFIPKCRRKTLCGQLRRRHAYHRLCHRDRLGAAASQPNRRPGGAAAHRPGLRSVGRRTHACPARLGRTGATRARVRLHPQAP